MEKSDTSAGEKRTNGILVWRIRHLKKLTQEGRAGQGRETVGVEFTFFFRLFAQVAGPLKMCLICPGCKVDVVCMRRNLKTFFLFFTDESSCVCVWGFQTSKIFRLLSVWLSFVTLTSLSLSLSLSLS